ncbi:MAG: hypothetical protein V1689_00775 [Pseudomonadota bacterium]
MKRIPRMWKLAFSYVIVLLVSLTVAGFFLDRQLAKKLEANLREEILTLARVISKALPDTEDTATLDAFCRGYHKIAGVRITIIRSNGRVIGESNRESIGIENHLERPEVQMAFREGTGSAIGFSKTLNRDMLYVALLLKNRDKIIRVAMPMTEVKAIENQVMVSLALALYLIPVIAVIIFLFAARHILPDENKGKGGV